MTSNLSFAGPSPLDEDQWKSRYEKLKLFKLVSSHPISSLSRFVTLILFFTVILSDSFFVFVPISQNKNTHVNQRCMATFVYHSMYHTVVQNIENYPGG